ncbi:MAG TPA: hypothetical protein VEH06_03895, partial [Candidatus Bathyarchaeia archaeon]|nr:hypothetical protein [Candidatus Bathyarchaeia archaeon]
YVCKTQLEKPPRDGNSPFIRPVVFVGTTKTMDNPGIANIISLHEQISKKSYVSSFEASPQYHLYLFVKGSSTFAGE